MARWLKYLRRVLAVLVGGMCLLYFLDILRILPRWMNLVPEMQIVPAIMAGSAVVLVTMGVLTLLLGRVYCSVVCPLGILQDVILRVKKWYYRLVKKRKRFKARYDRPWNWVRYGVLGIVAVLFAVGISYPLLLLDPYSNFGRIAVALVRPAAVAGNNLVAGWMNAAGNYTLYHLQQLDLTTVVAVVAGVVLLMLVVMVWRRGRLWCNSICPVGTLLGLISRFSLFKVRIDRNKCTHCGLCASTCKSHCMDFRTGTVDASRCVDCFDCLESCTHQALTYIPTWKRSTGTAESTPKLPSEAESSAEDGGLSSEAEKRVNEEALMGHNTSRRRFLREALATAALLPATELMGRQARWRRGQRAAGEGILPMPPGAVDRERFLRKCTACQLCVDHCPTNVLKPAFLENGLTGMMQPYMRFSVEKFCNYECKVCTEVCPNDALLPLTLEEKKLTRVGVAVFHKDLCKVFVSHVDCGACAEHCPTQAVHMVPFENGLTIPQVTDCYCIGCGGCESICPMTPPAIHIVGVDEQTQADQPTRDKTEVQAVDDFGF